MELKRFCKSFFSRIASKWAVLLVDAGVVMVSMLFACVLQYGPLFMNKNPFCMWLILFAVLCNVCSFRFFHTYVGVIRFSSFVDIRRMFLSLTLSYGLLILCNFCWVAMGGRQVLPNGLLFMAYVFTFFLMFCMRIAVKMIYEYAIFDAHPCENVFIYGFQGTGVGVARALRVSCSDSHRLCGFISDESDMIGKCVMGYRVYPNDEFLFERLRDKNVHTIVVSPNKISELESSGVLDNFHAHHIHVLTVPPLSDYVEEGLMREKQNEEKDMKIQRCVGKKIGPACMEGCRIMVTGAAGTVGREIVRQLAVLNPSRLILVDQAESPLYDVQLELADHWKNLPVRVLVADVANYTRMEAIFRETRPQVVFHAAAYKHRQLMENYVSEAIQTNVLGTVNITDLSVKYDVSRMILISTDGAHHPENSMEYSKRMAELYVQSYSRNLWRERKNDTRLLIVRFGDVCSKGDCNLITLPEACKLVLEVGSGGESGEIYLLDKINHETSMQDAPFVFEHALVRKCVADLIGRSYTDEASVLTSEMKRYVQKFAKRDKPFIQSFRVDISQKSYIRNVVHFYFPILLEIFH
ncbi:FlaA1/EpsC-like NDP-sugar epimerase [Bacteroides zoogleoformans]|uniref:Polysaccharide biosynthesis protein n=2 Tax=Bacteroides zoogleoformans TaxID=28119 RepID=A0ABM6T4B3_9BACE|nr:polysaccharide biosynthesis protein [Bacteroides zoogleoformans]TWJ13731.1 FlaA1/EpsC-like NDP-sugar epimerase [Bacteroides zoogleoformans]